MLNVCSLLRGQDIQEWRFYHTAYAVALCLYLSICLSITS